MRRRQAPAQQKSEAAGMMRWLLTYADMITLLLAFFIVLYSMSQLDQAKYQQLAQTLRSLLNGGGSSAIVVPGATTQGQDILRPVPHRGETQEGGDLRAIGERVAAALRQRGLGDRVQVVLTGHELEISLGESVFFDTGSADLKPAALPVLDSIGAALRPLPNPVEVHGFADSRPINTGLFPSNWELSAYRATTVIRYLQSQGIDPRRLSGVAYGEYHPLVPDSDPAHMALNRRVDIVVLRQTATDTPPQRIWPPEKTPAAGGEGP
ncbi:MAG: flagellar motor protein MotB [Bacillota bacterium]|nr:flagellar motor protein MotB [Bacillota bacterium]